MKGIKLMAISLVILFLLITILAALMPSTVLVSRAVNIVSSKDSLSYYLNDIQQWKAWIEGMDKPEVKIYSSTKADLAGTIVNLTNISDTTIISTWQTKDGRIQIATIRLIDAPLQKLTIVQWQFVQHLKWYPWEKFGSIMNDKILGTMMEKNLNSLKLLLEKNNLQ